MNGRSRGIKEWLGLLFDIKLLICVISAVAILQCALPSNKIKHLHNKSFLLNHILMGVKHSVSHVQHSQCWTIVDHQVVKIHSQPQGQWYWIIYQPCPNLPAWASGLTLLKDVCTLHKNTHFMWLLHVSTKIFIIWVLKIHNLCYFWMSLLKYFFIWVLFFKGMHAFNNRNTYM